MALKVGTRIGPYEVTEPLGAGGMGEVYRAHDTRLKRDVALKVLPEAFASDTERLARFHREAEVLATLNHPQIAAIYGIEESEICLALVLELVEGETIADRIARGPLPADEAIAIAASDRAGPRSRARAGHHSPGSEAREREGHDLMALSRCWTLALRSWSVNLSPSILPVIADDYLACRDDACGCDCSAPPLT